MSKFDLISIKGGAIMANVKFAVRVLILEKLCLIHTEDQAECGNQISKKLELKQMETQRECTFVHSV